MATPPMINPLSYQKKLWPAFIPTHRHRPSRLAMGQMEIVIQVFKPSSLPPLQDFSWNSVIYSDEPFILTSDPQLSCGPDGK